MQDRFIISLSVFDCKISGHITLHYYIILFNMYKESAFPAVCVHCEKMTASCTHFNPVSCRVRQGELRQSRKRRCPWVRLGHRFYPFCTIYPVGAHTVRPHNAISNGSRPFLTQTPVAPRANTVRPYGYASADGLRTVRRVVPQGTFIVILKRRNKVNQYPLLPPRTLHSFYCLYRQDLLY